MKFFSDLSVRLAPVFLVVACVGCQTHKTVARVADGYEEITYTKRAFLDEAALPRTAFEYRGANGPASVIWPSLYGVNEVIKGNLAVFVGDKGFVEDGAKVTHPRLFAVTPPGLPLDLTDEALWRWARVNGKDFGQTLENYSYVVPTEKNGRLELLFKFYANDQNGLSGDENWPDQGALELSWNQVAEIMRAVKTKGVQEKDLRWHTAYIGEKF